MALALAARGEKVGQAHSNLQFKVVQNNLKVKKQELKRTLVEISKKQEYEKQEFTKEQFNKAKEIANERGLLMSPDIRNLIDSRDPDLGAPMKRQSIDVEMCSSLNRILDMACTLNAFPLFKLDSNTRTATQIKYDINIKWRITF